jgi:hypothetical protein
MPTGAAVSSVCTKSSAARDTRSASRGTVTSRSTAVMWVATAAPRTRLTSTVMRTSNCLRPVGCG